MDRRLFSKLVFGLPAAIAALTKTAEALPAPTAPQPVPAALESVPPVEVAHPLPPPSDPPPIGPFVDEAPVEEPIEASHIHIETRERPVNTSAPDGTPIYGFTHLVADGLSLHFAKNLIPYYFVKPHDRGSSYTNERIAIVMELPNRRGLGSLLYARDELDYFVESAVRQLVARFDGGNYNAIGVLESHHELSGHMVTVRNDKDRMAVRGVCQYNCANDGFTVRIDMLVGRLSEDIMQGPAFRPTPGDASTWTFTTKPGEWMQ